LEAVYREFTGCKYALAVTGGTTALISALAGLQVGTGDEVIVPAYTYIATAAAVVLVGAIPVIAEIDDTLTLDPADVERKITPLTRAIIPVHMRGLPAQMDEIMAIARKHHLLVLEDVAQANGGFYKGRALGSIGHVGAFSFQHYKVITSGEGGMVVTDDVEIYQRASFRHDCALRFWQGHTSSSVLPAAGENARMCELHAAVGLTQFRRMAGILAQTRMLKKRIVAGLQDCPGIALQRVSDPEGDIGISVGFFLPTNEEARRFSRALAAEGIPNGTVYNQGVPDRHIYKHWDYIMNKWSNDRTGYPWAPQYYKGHVEYSPDMCPQSLDFLGSAIMINLSHRHTEEDADDIIAGIRKVAQAFYG
jgi:dTDP-4-amino-4,6-dideoxygalactose transaminase